MLKRRWPIVIALALVAAALLAAVVPIVRDLTSGRSSAVPGSRVVHFGTAAVGGPFELVDQNGGTRTEKDFAGKPFVVTFGYRRDDDQTRLLLKVLFEALARMGPTAEDVTPIFVTIDPERDTPDVLKPFASAIHPRLVALSGQRDAIDRALKTFKVWTERRIDAESPDGVRLDFQPLYFVMDRKGRYVGHADFTPSPRQLDEELRPLIVRANASR